MGEYVPPEKVENTPDSIMAGILTVIIFFIFFGALYYWSRKGDADLDESKHPKSNTNKIAVDNTNVMNYSG